MTTTTATTDTTASGRSRRSLASRLARLVPVAVAAGLSMGALADPAGAIVLDTDRPRITGQQLDFGTNWLAGAPLNGGYLKWDVTNGVVKPMLTGNLYINNAPGTCGRMQLQYFNSAGTKLATKNGALKCATDGSRHTFAIDMKPYSSSAITKVKVVLQVQQSSGSFGTIGSQYWYLG